MEQDATGLVLGHAHPAVFVGVVPVRVEVDFDGQGLFLLVGIEAG